MAKSVENRKRFVPRGMRQRAKNIADFRKDFQLNNQTILTPENNIGHFVSCQYFDSKLCTF